jgi:hypothetical protein
MRKMIAICAALILFGGSLLSSPKPNFAQLEQARAGVARS